MGHFNISYVKEQIIFEQYVFCTGPCVEVRKWRRAPKVGRVRECHASRAPAQVRTPLACHYHIGIKQQ